MAKLTGIGNEYTLYVFELIKHYRYTTTLKKTFSKFVIFYNSKYTIRETASSQSTRQKSRLLENFGGKLYDRRERCPSNEPRSLWSVFVTPHPLTFYIRQNLVETLNYTSQGSHFITKHYDGHYSLMPISQYSCSNCVGG